MLIFIDFSLDAILPPPVITSFISPHAATPLRRHGFATAHRFRLLVTTDFAFLRLLTGG